MDKVVPSQDNAIPNAQNGGDVADTPMADGFDFFAADFSGEKQAKEDKAEKPAKKEASQIQDPKPEPEEDDEEEVADDEGEEEDEEEVEDDDLEEPEAPKTQRKKPVVIKTSRKELKMPPSAKAAVMVAGKEELVTLEELTESYTSRSENRRRSTELMHKERALNSAKEEEQSKFKELYEKLSKPEEVMTALGEIIEYGGGEPLPALKTLRRVMVDNVGKMLGATPEQLERVKRQLQAFEMAEEANYYKEKWNREQDSKKKLAERDQVVQRVKQVMREFGIPDEQTFVDAFETLKQFKADNKLKVDDITPTDVGGYFRITQVVEAEFPALKNDSDAMMKLFKIAREENPTKEELRKLIKYWLSSGGEVKASEEGAEAKPKLSSKPKTSKQTGTKPNKAADLFL